MWRIRLKIVALFVAITAVFHARTLMSGQWTLLGDPESVNQGYSWFQFWINSLRHGQLPLWDPFTFSGHSFIGEMQTSAFSPLNLLLLLLPSNKASGLLSLGSYHYFIAFLQFLGLVFMYLLARDLRLSRVSSLLAGICFGFGGFVACAAWPDMTQSAIWLPVVLLFLLRALRSVRLPEVLLNGALGGLAMGMAVLGGRLHMVMMQAIVVATATVYHARRSYEASSDPKSVRRSALRALVVIAAVALICFGAGAVQLLPSAAYSSQALRGLGPVHNAIGNKAIPYDYLSSNYLLPQGVVTLLLPFAFNGNSSAAEALSPYVGLLPVFLAAIGIFKMWANPWVRYALFLLIGSVLYAMGPFSSLHSSLYVLVPGLWLMREPSRMLYLASFSLALLAGFGTEALFFTKGGLSWPAFVRVLNFVAAGAAVLLAVPAFFNAPPLNPWMGFSLVLFFLCYAILRVAFAGKTGPAVRVLAIGLVLFDLASYDWTPVNRSHLAEGNADHWVKLVSTRNAAAFLKSLSGPFRVDIQTEPPPNMGDAFSVLTNNGTTATVALNYQHIRGRKDLLNIKYVMKPASTPDPGAVFQDPYWKVYPTANAFPHAWIVHQVSVAPLEQVWSKANDPSVDLRAVGLLSGRPSEEPEPAIPGAQEDATFRRYANDELELTAHTQARGMLVLSEIYDANWRATVNGTNARVYQVDGALRGVIVPSGESRVVFRYSPMSVWFGGVLSILTFGIVLGAAFLLRERRGDSGTRPLSQAAEPEAVPGYSGL